MIPLKVCANGDCGASYYMVSGALLLQHKADLLMLLTEADAVQTELQHFPFKDVAAGEAIHFLM